MICHQREVKDVEFPVIFTTAEMLYDHQRDFLERIFNAEVFDYYGCNEVGTIAYECEHHKKHISEERLILETTAADDNPMTNAIGEFAITDLNNYVMPFIRYKIGDIGCISHDKCACGRTSRVINSLEGRKQDFLKAADGNYVPAVFFPCRFKDLMGLDQYQIIQTDAHNITVNIVKNKLFSERELKWMLQEIKRMIGAQVNVRVEEFGQIPLTRSGKSRLVKSFVPLELL
jgi:phenylacetate-CoA ligase